MGMIYNGDALQTLKQMPSESVQCCVTSPPYWGLRDYGVAGQLGLDRTPTEFVDNLVEVFREVRRVLKDDGTFWLNLGDSYAASGKGGGDKEKNIGTQRRQASNGLKPKDLVGIPWLVAFALRQDGWYLRSDIIWHKPNPMPESVTDRPTKSHEYLFLLTKSERYFYDIEATKEDAICGWRGSKFHTGKTGEHQLGRSQVRPDAPKGSFRGKNGDRAFRAIRDRRNRRNRRTVWSVSTKPFKGAHFATFPPDLIEPCIKAGSRPGDTVLDPFFGAGTTGLVAQNLARDWVGIELNPTYCELARERIGLDACVVGPMA